MEVEKLYLKKNNYDLILVINYNTNPILKIKEVQFLHLASKNLSQQSWLQFKKILKILPMLNNNTKLFI